MTQRSTKEKKDEQQLIRQQRQELKEELAEQYANLPRSFSPRKRRITFLVLGGIALLAVVFGWLLLLPSPTQQPSAGVPIGSPAPNFTLPVYYGGSGNIDLHSLRGHPVLLNFWSESCVPCQAEVPYLERTYKQHGAQEHFALLGINQADPKDDIAKFGANFHVTYPLLFDGGGSVNQTYGVTAIPTTYFIDSNGIVRYVVIQPLTPQTMKQGLAAVGITIS